VRDPVALQAVAAALDNTARVGLDLETTGLDPRVHWVRLLSLATGRGTFLVDCFACDPSPLFDLLAGRELVAHNAAFDLGFLAPLGFVPGTVHCTMLLSQVVHAGTKGRHTLAACVQRELGQAVDKAEQRSDWSGKLTERQLDYAARDADVLVPLYRSLAAKVRAAGLERAATIERRCLPAVVWLSGCGVALDRDRWAALASSAAAERDAAREVLERVAPPVPDTFPGMVSWNWNSPEQVKQALALAGCPVADTKFETLSAAGHPLALALVRFRDADKRCSTYGADWLQHVAGDGRVYPTWRQLGATSSGRMSCGGPNMQQLPRGAYRACVVAPPGRALVKADYSQIELRVAAKVSGDKALLEAYRQGEDLHTRTARLVLGVEDVTKEHRQLAKALNFGLLYGMGWRRFREHARCNYALDLSEADARRYRNAFFASYPGLAAWHRCAGRTHDAAVETRTLTGRRRLGVSRFTEKLNTPVQGTGADGLKLALALLWERRGECPGAFPVLAVHDEVVVECEEGQADAAAAWLRQALLDGMTPLLDPVPVEVEVRTARTWGGD
jgi:DNA polymerase-1